MRAVESNRTEPFGRVEK